MTGRSIIILKSHLSKLGGLEKQSFRIAEKFLASHCKVTILTNGPFDDVTLPSGIRIVNVGNTAKISFAHLWKFDQLCHDWIEQNGGDVIFGIERNTGVTHYRAGNGVHAEYLAKRSLTESLLKRISFYINPFHRSILRIEKQIFEDPCLRKIFTNSNMVKNEILQHYQVSPNIIEVMHNGVEWHELKEPFYHSLETRRSSDTYQLLFVGNGYKRKGLEYLLTALGKLRSKDFQLAVVGKESNQRYFEILARDLQLEDKVVFYGSQQNIIPFYQNADAIVIPSLYDPFANVTVEALAMGLHVVTSEYNGGKEVLDEETGIVISNLFDTDAVVDALELVMQRPKTTESAVKLRGSVEHLTFENQLDRLVKLTLDSAETVQQYPL